MNNKLECDKISDNIINKQSKKINFLGKGTYGIVFNGELDKKNIAIKFISKKTKYKNDSNHPANIEYNLGKDLKNKILDTNISPHINNIYKNNDCDLVRITDDIMLENEHYKKWFDESQKLIENKTIYPNVKIIYGELASTDLKKYILENYSSLTFNDHLILFFQFCYSLVCIQYYFKNFRHNDIKPNNILVELIETNENTTKNYNKYILFGKEYYIPQTKYILKIYDLDMAYTKDHKNYKVKLSHKGPLKNIGLSSKYNPVYDLHEYMNFYLRDFHTNNKNILPIEVVKLFKKLIPKNCFGKSNKYVNNYKLTNIKNNKINYKPKTMLSPSELFLYSNTFNIFCNKPENITQDNIINTYDSKIELNIKMLSRLDMFNVHYINK
jgi:hypothetical protein